MTRVHTGDRLRIPASAWNDTLSMLEEWKRSQIVRMTERLESIYNPSIIWIKNTTSSNLDRGDVLGIDSPLVSRTDNSDWFKEDLAFSGSAPSTSTPHYGQYAILREACPAGAQARAVISGAVLVKLTITHASDIAAEITNGTTTALTTGYVGTSRILWKESGTGSGKWGLIRVGDTLDNFVGKSDGTITTGSTGTISVWDAGFAGDLGMNVTGCYNHSATSLAAGDKVAGVILKGVPIVAKIC